MVKYILMQEHFQPSFDAKFISDRSRHRMRRQADPYAVEPWERNVLEIEIEPISEPNNYKTFYHTPLNQVEHPPDRKYSTLRHFSFRKEHEMDTHLHRISKKAESQRPVISSPSRQSTINHYNINGNLIQDPPSEQKKGLRRQWTLRTTRGRMDRPHDAGQATVPFNIQMLRQRVGLCRTVSDKQDQKYINLQAIGEKEGSHYLYSPTKPQRKVISVGFRKFSIGPPTRKPLPQSPLFAPFKF